MYKILIVDDEKMIRDGIRQVIPWKELEIGQVDLAASGKEALQIIRKEQPDILLTDISMAEMTGLDMIEQAAGICPGMRILVLTGYDSFEYARKALQLQVQDFLLKPIDEDVLTESLRKQVLIRKEQKNGKECLKRRAAGIADQGNLEHVMQNLIHNREQERARNALETKFHFPIEENMIIAVLVLQLYSEHEADARVISDRQIFTMCLSFVDAKNLGLSFWDENGKQIIIALFADRCGSDGVDVITSLAAMLRDEFGQSPKTALGNVVEGFAQLHKSYQDAMYLLENERSHFSDILITQSVQSRSTLFHDVYEQLLNEMRENVSNYAYVMRVYDAFCMAVRSYNLSEKYVRKCCFDIAAQLNYAYAAAGGTRSPQPLESLVDMLNGSRVEGSCEMIRQYLIKLLNQESEVHELVSKTKNYIRQQLSEELSVASIAENLFVSPNYLSRLFKRVTGEGCNEYIVRKRMEKASILLDTTSFSTGKIAAMVGYTDTSYFSITFKKHFGMSPSYYRGRELCENKHTAECRLEKKESAK